MKEWTKEETIELKREFLDTGIELRFTKMLNSNNFYLNISIDIEKVDDKAIEKMVQKGINMDEDTVITLLSGELDRIKNNKQKLKYIFEKLNQYGFKRVGAMIPMANKKSGTSLVIEDSGDIDKIFEKIPNIKKNEIVKWEVIGENFFGVLDDIKVECVGIKINNVTEFLNLEEIQSIGKKNPDYIVYVNNGERISNYNIKDYEKIINRLNYLVEDIDKKLPEKERFAKIYERVARSLTYDWVAAYPKNEEEQQYSVNNISESGNLKNGLIYGRCVCSGFAEILRNALYMVEIEAKYVSGECGYQTEAEVKANCKINKFGEYEDEFGKIWTLCKSKDGLYYSDIHAWNKVKLDGVWYNADACWDEDILKTPKRLPRYALLSDDTMEIIGDRDCGSGPKCLTDANKSEIEKLFSCNQQRENKKIKPRFHVDVAKKAKEFGVTIDDVQNAYNVIERKTEHKQEVNIEDR